jgi:hypothetical protein
MTYNQAYTNIDNLLDKTGTAYFTTTEKNVFLNLAVLEYTKGLINTLESDAQSMEKIAPLVVISSSLSQSLGVITFPTALPVYHILRAYTAVNNYNVNIMGYGEYASAKNNPYHKADSENPIGLLRSSSMDIIGNTENIILNYITIPTGTGSGAITNPATQTLGGYGINSGEEILNIAVRKMMLSLEDPRYQLQVNELTADKR